MRIDSAAVITDQDPQFVSAKFEFHQDGSCSRMPERIRHRLSTDPVNLITYNWMKKARSSFHHNTKISLGLNNEFLRKPRERLIKVLSTVLGDSQPLYCVATVLNHESHQLEDPVEQRLGRRIGSHAITSDMQLHRCTEHSL